MGTICILLGLIILIAFVGGGFFLAGKLITTVFMGQDLLSFIGIQSSASTIYTVCVSVLGFIGLLICLNLVMHGLTYNKVAKQNEILKKMYRHF